MKVTSIQNSWSFKGLNTDKVNDTDMRRVVTPCIKKLKELSKKADISLASSSVMKEFDHFRSPRPTLNILIKPLDKLNSIVDFSNYVMVIDEKKIKDKTLLQIIKKAIKII